jgi:predicted nucleic-acid-binding Zn-ribbon protein
MAKPEECEFFADRQCKALVREGTMKRDEACLNTNRASCCYACSRKDSCEISCDYLDDLETDAEAETTDSTNEPTLQQARNSASRNDRCPKCGGEMIEGETTNYVRILKPGDLSGDLVAAFYCRECGFVEFYKNASSKEPWRRQKKTEEQSKDSEEMPKEEGPSPETSRRKMIR